MYRVLKRSGRRKNAAFQHTKAANDEVREASKKPRLPQVLFSTLYAVKTGRDRQNQNHLFLMEIDGKHVKIHEAFS